MFNTTSFAQGQEIYSSPVPPMFYPQVGPDSRYSQLLQHDARSISKHSSPSTRLDSAEEFNKSARKEWVRRVAEWIAQTNNSSRKPLSAIPETPEEQSYGEEILYVASPPGTSHPVYPYGYSTSTPSLVSSTSASPSSNSSWSSSPKSLRRLSHGRTSSLESISEEAEE